MQTSLTIMFICILPTASLWSQADTTRSVEIGLNITQTLAGFFNAGGQQMPTDPYLFSLRLVGKKSTFRAGLNLRVNNSLEFQSNGDRKVRDLAFYSRAGWEKRIPVSDRFTLYWGIDGVLRYEEESVNFGTSSNSNLILRDYNWGIGGGPVLGIFFHLNNRISFSTEGSIYGIFYRGKEEEDLVPPEPTIIKDIRGFELLPAVPNSLYLIVRF